MNFANDLIVTGAVGIIVHLDTTPMRKVVISSALIVAGVILYYGFGVK